MQVTGSENQHHNEGNVFNHPKDPRQKMKFIWGEEKRNSFTCGVLQELGVLSEQFLITLENFIT